MRAPLVGGLTRLLTGGARMDVPSAGVIIPAAFFFTFWLRCYGVASGFELGSMQMQNGDNAAAHRAG